MRKDLRALFVTALLATLATALPNSVAGQPQENKTQRSEAKYEEKLYKEVRHHLVMLPWYSVFDNLAYKVDGDHVTLYGEVTRPSLKSDAESAVKSIEGVASVVNNIEVLPPSPMDDQLRRAVYRAIYGDAALTRYSIQAVPSIHIIVKGGNVTLEGKVRAWHERGVAERAAWAAPGVIAVEDRLTIA